MCRAGLAGRNEDFGGFRDRRPGPVRVRERDVDFYATGKGCVGQG